MLGTQATASTPHRLNWQLTIPTSNYRSLPITPTDLLEAFPPPCLLPADHAHRSLDRTSVSMVQQASMIMIPSHVSWYQYAMDALLPRCMAVNRNRRTTQRLQISLASFS